MSDCKRNECGECLPDYRYFINQQQAVFNTSQTVTVDCPVGYECNTVDPVTVGDGQKKIIPDLPPYDPDQDPNCDSLCEINTVVVGDVERDSIIGLSPHASVGNVELTVTCQDINLNPDGLAQYTLPANSLVFSYNPQTTSRSVAQEQVNQMASDYGKIMLTRDIVQGRQICDDSGPVPAYENRIIDTFEPNGSLTISGYTDEKIVSPTFDNQGRPGQIHVSGCLSVHIYAVVPYKDNPEDFEIYDQTHFWADTGYLESTVVGDGVYSTDRSGYVDVFYKDTEDVAYAHPFVERQGCSPEGGTSVYDTGIGRWHIVGARVASVVRQSVFAAGIGQAAISPSGGITYTNYLVNDDKYAYPSSLNVSGLIEATAGIPVSDLAIPSGLPSWNGMLYKQPHVVGVPLYRPVALPYKDDSVAIGQSVHGYELQGESYGSSNASIELEIVDSVPNSQFPYLPPNPDGHSVWRIRVQLQGLGTYVAIKEYGAYPQGTYITRPDVRYAESSQWADYVRAATIEAIPEFSVAGNNATAIANGRLPDIDGYTVLNNDRILVKDQLNPATNGIYRVTNVGSESTPFQMTRTNRIATYEQPASIKGTITGPKFGDQAGKFFVVNSSVTNLNIDPITWQEYEVKVFKVT